MKIQNFKRGLFEKICFQNFQKNHRHFLNYENFDIFLRSFGTAKNSSSHERKANRICIFGQKLRPIRKYFGSFYEIVRYIQQLTNPEKKISPKR